MHLKAISCRIFTTRWFLPASPSSSASASAARSGRAAIGRRG